MKAAFFTRTGPPEVIQYGELPDPRPGRGQCLVRVAAVDVNPIDTYVRSGLIPAKLTFPVLPGRDLAGTVVECGPEVRKFKPGDRVWGTNQATADRPGTCCELAAVDEQFLYPIPAGANEQEMAALSLVGVTAHLGLVRDARVRHGEIVFVNGGSGGVGSSVVQMAKALGARVITTAGTEEKVRLCRELGADLALNYRRDDVDQGIRSFAPDGVNTWWETLREPDFERAIPLLSLRGRMVVMAGREARPSFPVGPFYVKDCSLFGFAMFNASAEQLESAARDMNRWVSEGKLRARIDRVLPLSQTAEAHRLQEESTVQKKSILAGKIVLVP